MLAAATSKAVAVAAAAPAEASLLLPAEEEREACVELSAGQILHYRFEAGAELSFSAHYHRVQDARGLWRKDELRRDEGDIVAEVAARYCLFWHNYQERALTLHYTLTPR